jgi:splicing factor 3B subunit 5
MVPDDLLQERDNVWGNSCKSVAAVCRCGALVVLLHSRAALAERARGEAAAAATMASDAKTVYSQQEHLQMKYVGTGHADTTKWEWAVNQHRDTYASYIGHHSLLAYSAVAENESIGRLKYQYLQKMLSPCGKPPKKDDD